MLIRELLESVVPEGGRLLVWGDTPVPGALELGISYRPCMSPAAARAGDVLLTFVSAPDDVTSYWPEGLAVGVQVLPVIHEGRTRVSLGNIAREASRRGLQIVDAAPLSDLRDFVALVAMRTDHAVPPKAWLVGRLPGDASEHDTVAEAVSSHVLERSIGAMRADAQRHSAHMSEREVQRLEAEARALQDEVTRLKEEVAALRAPRVVDHERYREIAAAHGHLTRRIDAIYRSHTWRFGRVFWAIVHPLQAYDAVQARRSDPSLRRTTR